MKCFKFMIITKFRITIIEPFLYDVITYHLKFCFIWRVFYVFIIMTGVVRCGQCNFDKRSIPIQVLLIFRFITWITSISFYNWPILANNYWNDYVLGYIWKERKCLFTFSDTLLYVPTSNNNNVKLQFTRERVIMIIISCKTRAQ